MVLNGLRSWLIPCLFLVLLLGACDGGREAEQPVTVKEKLSIMSTPQDLSALLYIAEEKGFFSKNGLEVTIVDGTSGVESGKKLVNGEVDIAMMTDFAFAKLSSDNEELIILGSIAEAYNSELVARKDRGILKPSDLKGRIIGLKKGSSLDFYIDMFLTENGISLDDVQKIDTNVNDFVDALLTGKIDALAAWPPHTLNALSGLGDNGVLWDVQGAQRQFWLLTGMKNHLPRQQAITRLLKSLLQAQVYCAGSTTEPAQTLQRRLLLTDQYIDRYLHKFTFKLSLSSDLLSSLEYESRWILNQMDKSSHTLVPDFLDKIYFQGLDEVNPDSVTIIH